MTVFVECEFCGADVEKYPCEVNEEGYNYCSNDCHDEHRKELPPEEQPTWKGGKITIQCPVCENGHKVRPHRIEDSDNVFCSTDCYAAWKSENTCGPNNPNFESIAVNCDWCGKETYKLKGRIERSEQDFCSRECHNQWMSKYQHGPNHHQWKGGRRDYGPGWNEQKRESVRERHDRQCYDCGADESDVIADYGRKLDVHHLVVPSSDTNPVVHNAKRNLIPLCIPCHRQRENRQTPQSAAETAAEVSKV